MIESFQARSKSTIIEEHFFFGKRFLQNTKMKMKKPRYLKRKIISLLNQNPHLVKFVVHFISRCLQRKVRIKISGVINYYLLSFLIF